jgi:hypothetical protein
VDESAFASLVVQAALCVGVGYIVGYVLAFVGGFLD